MFPFLFLIITIMNMIIIFGNLNFVKVQVFLCCLSFVACAARVPAPRAPATRLGFNVIDQIGSPVGKSCQLATRAIPFHAPCYN